MRLSMLRRQLVSLMKKILSDISICLLSLWNLDLVSWWWPYLTLCDSGTCGTLNLVLPVLACFMKDYGSSFLAICMAVMMFLLGSWCSFISIAALFSFTSFLMNRSWNILCWNVRGQDKWDALLNKIDESSCSVLCLQETERESFDMS